MRRRMRGRSWATRRPMPTTCRPSVSVLPQPLAGPARPAQPQWAPATGRGRAGGLRAGARDSGVAKAGRGLAVGAVLYSPLGTKLEIPQRMP